jgi:hypothetical protein
VASHLINPHDRHTAGLQNVGFYLLFIQVILQGHKSYKNDQQDATV